MNILDLLFGELHLEDVLIRRDRVKGGWVCTVKTSAGVSDEGRGALPTSALMTAVSKLRKAVA